MRLTWNENPMMTTVELDEKEKELMWHKVKIDQMRWALLGVHFHLEDRKDSEYNNFDLDRARQECDPEYWYGKEDSEGDKPPCDKRVDELMEYFLEALMGPHCGDCTCVAATCDKCMAEEHLGIHTTRGLGKHQAVKIHSAFGEYMRPWKRKRDIHEVIEYLENYDAAKTPPDWEGWEPHVERWNEEAKNACEWLKNYRNEHFKRHLRE